MVPSSTPRSKKILLAIIATILLAAAALLLIGLNTKAANAVRAQQKAAAVEGGNAFANLLDSAKLIRDLAFLTTKEMAGRESGTPGNLLARQFIVKQFDSLGLEKPSNGRLQEFKLRGDTAKKGYNIIGIVKGTKFHTSYIVVTAHYDHVGTRNGDIYYGADDNASGAAGLLAMAQYFKKHPPIHSILFVAFDAEEKGLWGSRYFVDHPPVPQQAMMVNVNMDMVSRNDQNEIYASGLFHYPFLKKYVDSVQSQTPVTIKFGHDDPSKGGQQDWTSQSDHFHFHSKKIPYIYFGVEDHADYHKPTDTFDKIDKGFYYRVCNMIARTILVLDKNATYQLVK